MKFKKKKIKKNRKYAQNEIYTKPILVIRSVVPNSKRVTSAITRFAKTFNLEPTRSDSSVDLLFSHPQHHLPASWKDYSDTRKIIYFRTAIHHQMLYTFLFYFLLYNILFTIC